MVNLLLGLLVVGVLALVFVALRQKGDVKTALKFFGVSFSLEAREKSVERRRRE